MLKFRTIRSAWHTPGTGIHYKKTLILMWWQRRFRQRAATSHEFFLCEWIDMRDIIANIKPDPLWVRTGWDISNEHHDRTS